MKGLFFSISLLIGISVSAQIDNYQIEQLSLDFIHESLETEVFFEDSYSYMWIGTNEGLIRYNGVAYKRYVYDYNDSSSIGSNRVYAIAQISEKHLLIGSDNGGLVVFDYTTDKFESVPIEIDDHLVTSIRDIIIDTEQNIWIASLDGVIKLNTDFEIVEYFLSSSLAFDGKGSDIFDIHQTKAGDIICTMRKHGVFLYNDSTFVKVFPKNTNNTSKAGYFRLTELTNGQICIGTYELGLVYLNSNGEFIKNIELPKGHDETVGHSFYVISNIDDNVLLGGLNLGLFYEQDSTLHTLDLFPDRFFEILPSLTCILADSYDNIWIGSHRFGIFKLHKNSIFKNFAITPSGSTPDISSFAQESENELWIGTDGAGIVKYNQSDFSMDLITANDGLKRDGILDVYKDEDELWLSHWGGGITKYNTKSKKISYILPDVGENTISSYDIKDIHEVRDTLWIIAHGDGMNLYVKETGEFITPKKNTLSYKLHLGKWGNKIYSSSDGRVWVVSTHGLVCYHNGSSHLYLHNDNDENSLYDNLVNSVLEDSNGTLWVGTEYGLQYFNEDKSKIIRVPNELVPYTVKSIIQKDNDELFIATNQGLILFNFEDNTSQFFTTLDGIGDNVFVRNSVFKSSDNKFYWGSNSKITVFEEKENEQEITNLNLIVSSIEIKDYNDSTTFEAHHVYSDTSIVLDYSHSKILLEYSGLGVNHASRVTYSYKLKGIDNNFIESNSPYISYSKLEPGTYTLIVKAKYNDDEVIRKITFIVTPPFYKTWWFVLISIIVLSFIIYRIILSRINRLKGEQKKLEKLVDERTSQLKSQNKQLLESQDEVKEAYNELKYQSAELSAANEHLQELNTTKNTLVSILAHDLKNNFSPVLGYARLIEEGSSPNAVGKYIPLINNGIEKTDSLLNNTLQWIRSQSETIVLQKENVSISKILNLAIEQNQSAAILKDVKIKKSFSDEYYLNGDINTLVIVFRNLIQNAIKFSNESTQVEVKLNVEAESLYVSIIDFGKGISAEKQKDIFSKTSKNIDENTSSGTGIGLILCREFSEKNDGQISVESIEGRGATFTVKFPFVEQGEDVKIQPEQLEQQVPQVQDLNIEYKDSIILLVDDDDELRNQFYEELSKHYKVEVARNGEEGREIASKIIPDIIITDFEMPEMKGDELCRALKTNTYTSHIPVIMLSAYNSDEDKMTAFEAGVDDYLVKPFNINELIMKVSNLLSTRENLRQTLMLDSKTGQQEDEKTSGNTFFNEIITIIEDNYTDPNFSVEKLAEMLNCSRASLYKKMKASSNYSPIDLIITFKLKKAKNLLQTGQFSVSEVAYMCGFSIPTYFSKRFKEYYGVTPTEMFPDKD